MWLRKSKYRFALRWTEEIKRQEGRNCVYKKIVHRNNVWVAFRGNRPAGLCHAHQRFLYQQHSFWKAPVLPGHVTCKAQRVNRANRIIEVILLSR
jgi:hypothetical protein